MSNILHCEPLLENYALNTFTVSPTPSQIQNRMQEITHYLQHYPPEIYIYPLTDSHGATVVEALQNSPSGYLRWYMPAGETIDHSRQRSPRRMFLHRHLVDALCCAHAMSQAGQELGEGYLSPRSIIQLLSATLVITLVHEVAHVAHATFAELPPSSRISGRGTLMSTHAFDSNPRSLYLVGESGDSAENVLSGGEGEFHTVFADRKDCLSVTHLAIHGKDKKVPVHEFLPDEAFVHNLIEGTWIPAHRFATANTAQSATPNMISQGGHSSAMSDFTSPHEPMCEPVSIPESPAIPCPPRQQQGFIFMDGLSLRV
ncbi:hypothetical protein F4604DRAFT_1777587 [Suillus subluteus]|nr:hypothetical protein F4604DRAFT_1777587 [Suillus subluteus]